MTATPFKCKKGLSDGRKCATVLCMILWEVQDPRYSDEKFKENVNMRIRTHKKGEL